MHTPEDSSRTRDHTPAVCCNEWHEISQILAWLYVTLVEKQTWRKINISCLPWLTLCLEMIDKNMGEIQAEEDITGAVKGTFWKSTLHPVPSLSAQSHWLLPLEAAKRHWIINIKHIWLIWCVIQSGALKYHHHHHTWRVFGRLVIDDQAKAIPCP